VKYWSVFAARSPSGGSDPNADEPAWFEALLADRGTRKPSPHTMTASRQDFEAIAAAIVGDGHPVGTHEARLCQHAVRILI
jgi:hypothetical protein